MLNLDPSTVSVRIFEFSTGGSLQLLQQGEVYGFLALRTSLYIKEWGPTIQWHSLQEMLAYLRQEEWKNEWYAKKGDQYYHLFCFMQEVKRYLSDIEERKVKPFRWMSWKASVMRKLKSGDMERTAWALCCNLAPDDADEIDLWGERKIFTDPKLIPHHQQLWQYMQPEITPEYLGSVKEALQRYGWKI